MARSGMQQVTRWVRRNHRPVFAFDKLPVELQLLILCKSDPLTARKFITASSRVRGLYLHFSGTALPSIIAQLPAPINTLLCVSMDLDAMQDNQFDPVSILEKLSTVNLFEWLELLPYSTPPIVDPILALQSVSDVYGEAQEAANLIGKLIIIRVERFVNPHTCVPPITLSTTEHTRLASTLLIIKIFYQLRAKFLGHGEYAGQFAPSFWKSTPLWLMNQGITLDRLLRGCWGECEYSLCHWDQAEYDVLKRLTESLYVRSFHPLYFQNPASIFRTIPGFSHNLSGQHRGGRGPGYWHHEPSNVGHPAMSKQLRNHISSCSDPALHSVTQAQTSRYASICRQLGLYFWDYTRLSDWGLADPIELIAAVDACPGLSQVAMRYDDTPDWEIGIRPREAAVERTKQRQIIEWTRCPVQCSLEEWLWQKTALQQLQKGEEVLPVEHIVIGTFCDSCSLDGHLWSRCRCGIRQVNVEE